LITNAIDAMATSEHGARILPIETKIDQTNFVVSKVADTGPGFDAKVAEKLFKPLFTTKPSGMGLGLSICESIIEAHDGRTHDSHTRTARGGVPDRLTRPPTRVKIGVGRQHAGKPGLPLDSLPPSSFHGSCAAQKKPRVRWAAIFKDIRPPLVFTCYAKRSFLTLARKSV